MSYWQKHLATQKHAVFEPNAAWHFFACFDEVLYASKVFPQQYLHNTALERFIHEKHGTQKR